MNIEKAPKQFCDNVSVAFSQDFFALGMTSGEQGTAYALTPQHTKRLLQYLTYRVNEYEQKHGPINVEPWSPDIKSPLQMASVKS